jgi:type I restriction enzyme S subunit
MIGTIGLIYFEQSDTINYAIKNIGLFKTSQNLNWTYYTYLWLTSLLGKDFVYSNKSGSTQEYISLTNLRNIIYCKPPLELLDSFNAGMKKIFEKIKSNTVQIQTLSKARDTLLPKLMSGQVRTEGFDQ